MTPVIPDPTDPSNDAPPEFAFSAWNGEAGERDEVRLFVHTTSTPSEEKHASLGLLYGLALMALDQQGAIASAIDALLADGPVSEAQAVEHINFLMQEDYNATAI